MKLLLIISILFLTSCFGGSDRISDYLKYIRSFEYQGETYSIYFKVTGFHDKVIYIELYRGSDTSYQRKEEPLFSQYIDQEWTNDVADNPTREPVDAIFDIESKMIIVIFNNSEQEVFDLKDIL